MALLQRYPTVTALASADPDELSDVLFPLGLQVKRAQHLVACARRIADHHSGRIPMDPSTLMSLPYVGEYVASAMACFCGGKRRAVVDANVSRVYQRVFGLPRPTGRLGAARSLWEFSERMLPQQKVREYNWALLDLGGTICTARRRRCGECPVSSMCAMRIGELADNRRQSASKIRHL